MRPVVAALVVVGTGLAACDRTFGPPEGPRATVTVPLTATFRLGEDVPTFKVDARLGLVWESQPVGGNDLGTVVLPADERDATFDLQVPDRRGRLLVREETVTPRAPFLCGAGEFLDPRETAATTVVLALCVPG